MRNLTNSELKLFKQLLCIGQKPLKKALGNFLKTKYDNVVITEEYIYAAGDIPVALVAHLDTVFKSLPTSIFYDKEQNVMWSPQGLGADDRAGVFSICQIIKSGLKPHVIFTTDEEIGGFGARTISRIACPFKDLRFIVELDRRGEKDCVFYDCDNKDFQKYIEGFGFKTDWGSFSDISYIAPAWKVAAVNLSIGYYGEHSQTEILSISNMLSTIEKVKVILKEDDLPSFEYVECEYSYNWLQEYYNIGKDRVKCCACSKQFDEVDTYPVQFSKDTKLPVCLDCISKDYIKWCPKCGEPYIIETDLEKYQGQCYKCQDEKYGGAV